MGEGVSAAGSGWNGRRVVVTGGTGFIGGALVRVCQLPSGAWYFSPGAVRAMARQPEVKAYSSSVALAACAFSA